MAGLELLRVWLCARDEQEQELFGNAAEARKIRIKLTALLHDLLLNDDGIIGDGFHVRDTFAKDPAMISALLLIVQGSDIKKANEDQFRNYTLNCLFRINQREMILKTRLKNILNGHLTKLKEAIATIPERVDALQAEVELVQKVIDAPNLELTVNFPDQEPENVEPRSSSTLLLKTPPVWANDASQVFLPEPKFDQIEPQPQ